MRYVLAAAFALLVAGSASAQEVQFCVAISGRAPQCHYRDAPSCEEAAARARGACVVRTDQSRPMRDPMDVFDAWDAGQAWGEREGRRAQDARNERSSQEDWRRFCEELRDQDLAELDRLVKAGETDTWERLFPLYWARSDQCFAQAR